MISLKESLEAVREKIRGSADLSGRDPESVTLVAVSKGHPAWIVKAAFEHHHRLFGESRVQEAHVKAAQLAGAAIEWHLVGRLQKNKVRQALSLFSVIQSVDSLALLERMDRIAGETHVRPRVLVQVDLAGEATKIGVPPVVLPELMRRASDMPHVEVEGLMLLPPFFEQPERGRPYFRKLADLLRELNEKGCYRAPLIHLSMGMTHDYDVAISEGATIVRVGTAIFGERPRPGAQDMP